MTPKLAEQLVKTYQAMPEKVEHCFLVGAFDQETEFKSQGVSIQVKKWYS